MKQATKLLVILGLVYANAAISDPTHLIKECQQGDAQRCHTAGWVYEYALGTPTNIRKAAYYYRKACDGGIGASCIALATLYETGRGVPVDTSQAIQLRAMACDHGNPQACVFLGSNYHLGKGVPMDQAKAADLLEKACIGWEVANCSDILEKLRSKGGIDYGLAIRLVYQGIPSIYGPKGCIRRSTDKNPEVKAP